MKTEIIKTYKHKTTGWLAKLTTTNSEYQIYRTDNTYAGQMASILFENTNDWDLVVEDDFIVLDTWCNNKTYYLKINDDKNKYRCLGGNITKPYHFIDTIEYTINTLEIDNRFVLVDINKQKDKNKGYQILTVVDPNPKSGIISVTDGTFNYTSGDVINSIRRLSDGEIFSIGDKIGNGSFKIEKISLEEKDNEIFFHITHEHAIGVLKLMEISKIIKEPLFVTEDGIEIRIGDDYWVYDYGCLKDTENQIHKVYRASQTHTGDGVNRKYFSTKEKAEEYILYNKHCLSFNDVIDIIKKYRLTDSYTIAFEELCKSRIKL